VPAPKGHKAYPGSGRPKGVPNKVVADIRAACQLHGESLVLRLVELSNSIDGATAIGACKVLLAYGYGKPTEHIRLSDPNDKPLHFTLTMGEPLHDDALPTA